MKTPETTPPVRDEVLAEVRRAREKIDAECGHDLATLCRRLQTKQRRSGRTYVDRSDAKPLLARSKP